MYLFVTIFYEQNQPIHHDPFIQRYLSNVIFFSYVLILGKYMLS